MNRENKYRAWDNVRNKMWEWNMVSRDIDLGNILSGKSNLKPLQFTGLKDKNGVEIYEGDILETDKGYIQKVDHITETIDGTTYVSGFYAWDEEKYTWMAIDTTDEVIGNIYENPELLEETK